MEQIDAVLKYLPLLEERDFQFGQWRTAKGGLSHFLPSPEVGEFISALYKQNLIITFDWRSWGEEARQYQLDRAALEAADLLTIRKLLTAHVRADRFVEGHLASVFDEGLLTAILRRLKGIRDEMTGDLPTS